MSLLVGSSSLNKSLWLWNNVGLKLSGLSTEFKLGILRNTSFDNSGLGTKVMLSS